MDTLQPGPFFDLLWDSWCNAEVGAPKFHKVAAAGLVKDCRDLLGSAPLGISNLLPEGFLFRSQLRLFVDGTVKFLKTVSDSLQHTAGVARLVVSAPWSGGCKAARVDNKDVNCASTLDLRVASLNPGNAGFSSLRGGHTIWWKLWEIAEFGLCNNIAILVVPGPRFPPGTVLPDGFPYVYVGPASGSWDSVGVLLLSEIAPQVEILDHVSGSDRRLWMRVNVHMQDPMFLVAFYGITGDDSFFRALLDEAQNFPYFFGIGDGNIHLASVVVHPKPCTCSHCKQSSADRAVEKMFMRRRIQVLNPVGERTHDSGTIIDLLICSHNVPILPAVAVLTPRSILNSDHGAIIATFSLKVLADYSRSFGRVAWSGQSDWATSLSILEPLLHKLALIVEALAGDSIFVALAQDRKQVGRRRELLNSLFWLRNAWYTLAGHLGGNVRVSAPRQQYSSASRRTALEKAKEEVDRRTWTTWKEYIGLRNTDKNLAIQYLSKVVKPKQPFRIHLLDEDTGAPLDTDESVNAILDDLMQRPAEATPLVDVQSHYSHTVVSHIRQSNALYDPELNLRIEDKCNGPYTIHEFEMALKTIKASKVALCGSLAATKAACKGGRALSLALSNCVLMWQVCPEYNAIREINPIRKKGPSLVQKLKCLRPVSQATDLAALQDALWLNRHKDSLIKFWGPSQYGGQYEALAAVICVVLLSQLRTGAHLSTWWNFSDERSAFDVVPKDDIRLGTFRAGVVGASWMLLDDVLRQDAVRVRFMHLMSVWTPSIAGIGQGRKMSLHNFNTAAKFLHDVIESCSLGAGAPLTGVLAGLLHHAEFMSPSTSNAYDPVACLRMAPLWRDSLHQSYLSASIFLQKVVSSADRKAILDLAYDTSCVIIQYVDDNAMPASSLSQSCAIWHGCTAYSDTHGPRFNVDDTGTKSACMPIGEPIPNDAAHWPIYGDKLKVPVVSTYVHLGVVLQNDMSFDKHLNKLCCLLTQAFNAILGLTSDHKLPFVVLADLVPTHVCPAGSHGISLCISVCNAESRLNRLQADWARTILGLEGYPHGLWNNLISECGWSRRLGTRMFAEAVMLEARVLMLPKNVSAFQLLNLAMASPCSSWATHVKAIRGKLGNIPDISTWLENEVPDAMRADAIARKHVLRKYRVTVLEPALKSYDHNHFIANQDPDWYYLDWQTSLSPFSDTLLATDWSASEWKMYRVWAVTRCTGRWPQPACVTHLA